MPQAPQISIRLTPDCLTRLDALAGSENRNRSNMISTLIGRAWEVRGVDTQPDAYAAHLAREVGRKEGI
jgi:predicted transcriptional regulator